MKQSGGNLGIFGGFQRLSPNGKIVAIVAIIGILVVIGVIVAGIVIAVRRHQHTCPSNFENYRVSRDLINIATRDYMISGPQGNLFRVVGNLPVTFSMNSLTGKRNLDLRRDLTVSSMIFPSYLVTIDGTQIATINYRVDIGRRYQITYGNDQIQSSQDLVAMTPSFTFMSGSREIARVTRQLISVGASYDLCIDQSVDDNTKDLIFATVIAFDQHAQ